MKHGEQRDVNKITSIRDKWDLGEVFNIHRIGLLGREKRERMVQSNI